MSTLPPVVPRALSSTDAAPPRQPLRVLLVEDNPDDALLLRRHLEQGGFAPDMRRVETANAMLEALRQPVDCVLADYNLPNFSAPAALRLLQSTGQDLPFIMMSGAVDEATAVAAMRAGAHDYVSKGNLTRLCPAIERELAEAAGRRNRRVTEQALRSSEERFHRLLEATPLALLIVDMQGKVNYSNRGACHLLGCSAVQGHAGEEALTLASIFSTGEFGVLASDPSASCHVAVELRRKIDSHERETWETLCCHANGWSIPVLIAAAVLNPEASEPDLLMAVFFVDLTEQKQGEQTLRRTEKLAAAGRLAASIAHEINNPLEAITNCLYLLEQSDLEPGARSYLGMAQRELDRVTHITTQTLRFYRQSTRPVPTDIAELLNSVLTLFEARLRSHNLDLHCDFAGAPPVLALDGEIRQVLANMVGNAMDALVGCEAPRTLMLRAKPRRSWRTGEPGVVILIADRGTGMSRETLKKIYEPFFSTKGITGTGLGLWVSAEIVNKHGGRVLVRSSNTHPSGTVFRIFLPLVANIVENTPFHGVPSL